MPPFQTTSENLIADKPESQVAMDLTNTYWKRLLFLHGSIPPAVFDPKQNIGNDSSGGTMLWLHTFYFQPWESSAGPVSSPSTSFEKITAPKLTLIKIKCEA
jgi:hypothetical protein